MRRCAISQYGLRFLLHFVNPRPGHVVAVCPGPPEVQQLVVLPDLVDEVEPARELVSTQQPQT